MAILELAVLLAVMAVAAYPCWRYSADWGYGPSASVGVLLLFVAIFAITNGVRPEGKMAGQGGRPHIDRRTDTIAHPATDIASAPHQ
ncbi:MAG TPA: DUF3309 family protein [Reyranella sp.]|nr:DUF3309 family protein [Reyranella sp.]